MKDYFQGQVGSWLADDEVKQQRTTLRERVINWLCAGCGLLLLILALGGCTTMQPPVAQVEEVIPLHVLEKDGVVINLMGTPCVDRVSLDLVLPKHHSRLREIRSVWPERDGSRKAYAGCWMEVTKEEANNADGGFLVVFEDREHTVIEKSEFKRGKGQAGA